MPKNDTPPPMTDELRKAIAAEVKRQFADLGVPKSYKVWVRREMDDAARGIPSHERAKTNP